MVIQQLIIMGHGVRVEIMVLDFIRLCVGAQRAYPDTTLLRRGMPVYP